MLTTVNRTLFSRNRRGNPSTASIGVSVSAEPLPTAINEPERGWITTKRSLVRISQSTRPWIVTSSTVRCSAAYRRWVTVAPLANSVIRQPG